MSSPRKIYSILLKKLGPQGWWPITPRDRLVPVYHRGRYSPKTSREKLEICLGAILTQNTAWANVEKALINLNKERVLSVKKLLAINSVKLQKLIKPSGYFVQKAKKIKFFCRFLKKNYSGSISKFLRQPTAILRKNLLSLWGIGFETADSILLYGASRPVFVIDSYTMRLSQRMGWFEGLCYRGAQKFFMLSLPRSFEIYNEFHALFVLLGKNFCKPKPLCSKCPIANFCLRLTVVV